MVRITAVSEGYACRCDCGDRHHTLLAGSCFLSTWLVFKSHLTVVYRTITTTIPSLDVLHSTFSQFLHLPFLANVFFLPPRKSQMIVAHVWVQRSSRNSRS